jgi:hypothetical protein
MEMIDFIVMIIMIVLGDIIKMGTIIRKIL